MKEYRCQKCGKLLFRVDERTNGKIEVKCTKCKEINKFDFKKKVFNVK